MHIFALLRFISLYRSLRSVDTHRRIFRFSGFLILHLAKAALVLTRLVARASAPSLLGESE